MERSFSIQQRFSMTTGRDDVSHRDRLNLEEEKARNLTEIGNQLEAQDFQGLKNAFDKLQQA